MKNEPNKVYLNVGAEANPKRGDFKDHYEITWSSEAIHENDLEYLSANHMAKVIKDRINHLKSEIKGLRSDKLDKCDGIVHHLWIMKMESSLKEQYWLLHKLGLADEKRR